MRQKPNGDHGQIVSSIFSYVFRMRLFSSFANTNLHFPLQTTYSTLLENKPLPLDTQALINDRITLLRNAVRFDWSDWIEEHCPGQRRILREAAEDLSNQRNPAGSAQNPPAPSTPASPQPSPPAPSVPASPEPTVPDSTAPAQTVPSQPSPPPPNPPQNPVQTSGSVAPPRPPTTSPQPKHVTIVSSDDSDHLDSTAFNVPKTLPATINQSEWDSLIESGKMLGWCKAQQKALQEQVRMYVCSSNTLNQLVFSAKTAFCPTSSA